MSDVGETHAFPIRGWGSGGRLPATERTPVCVCPMRSLRPFFRKSPTCWRSTGPIVFECGHIATLLKRSGIWVAVWPIWWRRERILLHYRGSVKIWRHAFNNWPRPVPIPTWSGSEQKSIPRCATSCRSPDWGRRRSANYATNWVSGVSTICRQPSQRASWPNWKVSGSSRRRRSLLSWRQGEPRRVAGCGPMPKRSPSHLRMWWGR